MTLAEAIAIVRRHNAWRRGDSSEMLPPTVIGQALDALCDHAERMERELVAPANPHRGSDFNEFIAELQP